MARLQVKVKPNARENLILEQTATSMKVAVAAPPEKGKANLELARFLSKKLKKQVRIVSGFGSSTKIIEISDK
jgi:hypothetical protein